MVCFVCLFVLQKQINSFTWAKAGLDRTLGRTAQWEMAVWDRDAILSTKVSLLLMSKLPFQTTTTKNNSHFCYLLVSLFSGSRQETCPNCDLCAPEKTGSFPPLFCLWTASWKAPDLRSLRSHEAAHTVPVFPIMSMLWWNAETLLQGMFSHSTMHTQLAPAWDASHFF